MNYAFVCLKKWGYLSLVFFLLVGCQKSTPVLVSATPSPHLVLYATSSTAPGNFPDGSPSPPLALLTPNATPSPLPSPTPFTYKVKKGDTLLGIAIRHGVTLENLQAANPTVSARMLSVGTELVIPLPTAPVPTGGMPTPTPIQLALAEPACYPAANGGLWCYAPLHNDQPLPLESVSAWITLLDSGGEVITSTLGTLPLNIIPSGMSLPLTAYIPAGTHADPAAMQVDISSAFTVQENDPRYILVEVENIKSEVQAGGKLANVSADVVYALRGSGIPATPTPTSGVVISTTIPTISPTTLPSPTLPPEPPAVNSLWVALVAYGGNEQVVGTRRLELQQVIPPGTTFSFQGVVYSAGPPISRVEVIVEAHP